MPTTRSSSDLVHKLSLSATARDVARLRALASGLPFRRSQLMREALRLGLDAIEADPSVIVRPRPQAEERGR